MSENTNRRDQDFAKYDAMSTEELEEILRLDLDAPPEQESDTQVLLTIMEVLAQRKKEPEKKAFEALESFRRNYMPKENPTAPVLNCKKKTNSRTPARWLRTLAATAAVIAVILLTSVTAKAFGWDLWDAVIKWTEDTFHISIGGPSNASDPGENDGLPYSSLEEALLKKDVDVLLAPQWIPAGYVLTDISIEETPFRKTYNAIYHKGESSLRISIFEHIKTDPEYVEQGEGLIETYEASGITYYLFANNSRTQAVWINESFECYILGELTISELKSMIDSIGKG